MSRYLALDKLARCLRIIRKNGGPIGSIFKLWRTDTLKDGTLVGTDKFGNKYFENPYYMISRCRWVEFNPKVKWDYDGSQITAEWFGWLHYKTDLLPKDDCAKYCLYNCSWTQCWLQPHLENLSGTKKSFYPYKTTTDHISVWDGSSMSSRDSKNSECGK